MALQRRSQLAVNRENNGPLQTIKNGLSKNQAEPRSALSARNTNRNTRLVSASRSQSNDIMKTAALIWLFFASASALHLGTIVPNNKFIQITSKLVENGVETAVIGPVSVAPVVPLPLITRPPPPPVAVVPAPPPVAVEGNKSQSCCCAELPIIALIDEDITHYYAPLCSTVVGEHEIAYPFAISWQVDGTGQLYKRIATE